MKRLWCIALLLFPLALWGNQKVDSLKALLSTAPHDTVKVNWLNDIAEEYQGKSPEDGLQHSEKALALAREIGYTKGMLRATFYIGYAKDELGKFDEAMALYKELLQQSTASNSHYYMAMANNSIGAINYYQSNYEAATRFYFAGIAIAEEHGLKKQVGNGYANVATVYSSQQRWEKSLEYFAKALTIYKELGDDYSYAATLINTGNVYANTERPAEAIAYYNESRGILEQLGDEYALAIVIGNIGSLHEMKGALDEAETYHEQALALQIKLGNEYGEIDCYVNLGSVANQRGHHIEAIAYYHKALDKALVTKARIKEQDAYYQLAQAYRDLNDYKKADHYHQLYTAVKDSIFNETSTAQVAEMEAQYQNEKKAKEIEFLKTDQQLKDARLERNNAIIIASSIGLVLLLLLAIMIFAGYRRKRNANQLLASQNAEISLQKQVIEEKNKDITDSIRYAEKIQSAILPSLEKLTNCLPQSFVYYQPKDIVSGDFYWVEHLNDRVLFAVVDCTGHGVPGAFMSIVGHNLLNRAVHEKGLVQPATILNFMNEGLTETLRQQGESHLRDGMDMAICSLRNDGQKHLLEYAGANNSLYLVQQTTQSTQHASGNAAYTLKEVKADKQPIGNYYNPQPFTNHEIALNTGDLIYTFTDGYADQFGGPKGKKFKYSQFKSLLLSVAPLPMAEQQQQLHNTLVNWKGALEQLDDVCVIGVKVP